MLLDPVTHLASPTSTFLQRTLFRARHSAPREARSCSRWALAGALVASALATLTTSTAQAQTVTLTESGITRNVKFRSQDYNPNWISYQDCVDDAIIYFPVSLTGFNSSTVLEIWAGAGTDCTDTTNRTSTNALCWQVGALGTIVQNPSPLPVKVRDIVGRHLGSGGGVGTGTRDDCDNATQTSEGPDAVTLYFMPISSSSYVGTGVQYTGAKVDTKPPVPPTAVSLGIGEGLLKVSWPQSAGPDIFEVRLFCDRFLATNRARATFNPLATPGLRSSRNNVHGRRHLGKLGNRRHQRNGRHLRRLRFQTPDPVQPGPTGGTAGTLGGASGTGGTPAAPQDQARHSRHGRHRRASGTSRTSGTSGTAGTSSTCNNSSGLQHHGTRLGVSAESMNCSADPPAAPAATEGTIDGLQNFTQYSIAVLGIDAVGIGVLSTITLHCDATAQPIDDFYESSIEAKGSGRRRLLRRRAHRRFARLCLARQPRFDGIGAARSSTRTSMISA
ncbi:MAG: hypothetical protein U0165_01570 [Polyangiaceae bacterium]